MKKNFFIYLPLLFSLVMAAGIYIGFSISSGRNQGEMPTIQLGGSRSGKLDLILNYIERDYVDTVNRRQLENTAITGMLEKLDPHSSYISPEMFHEMNDPLLGSFEGIGVSFRIEKDTIMVINPVKGGPSERVGIMAGDRIVMIDDSLVAGVGITNHDAMRKLKGPKGTQVKVSVSRRGVKGLKDFVITRDVIPTYSLDIAYMIDNETGFVRLNKFAATTYKEFIEGVRKLRRQGMQRLIVDLRGNAGGYLKAATDLADEFLPEGKLIVYTEGKNRPRSYTFATRTGMLEEMPVIVLIDEGSASASEIVAGALQDNDRGTIVGRRSFGKGLVQEQMTLRDGSAVRLTVARYYTPTGRSIQRPYDGDFSKYHHEPIDRFLNGEVSNPDSLHFADTVKFVTPGGKIVYGGGGILPDIYVPLKPDSSLAFFTRLANSGLIFQYAFEYADANRQTLRQYKDVSDFIARFRVTDAMLQALYRQAAERGITALPAEQNSSARHTRILLKAYIGRNLYDDEGFYPIYQEIDEVLQKALEILRKPNA
ncbi:MAG: S41 family peptidase [Bacteroidetes bacterium]|nr:S41 family peptidase [Bacteroidota bacterium]